MILIIEDDDITRSAMKSLLSASGYENVAVQSAEEALELLAAGSTPQAAVVDWDLPGMNGIDFIEQLGKQSPGTPAVLVTGAARERVDDAVRTHGVQCIRKPLDFKHLLRMLPKSLTVRKREQTH